MLYRVLSLPGRIFRRLQGDTRDYRLFLFEHLVKALDGKRPARILEIGPRDGVDTERLLTLGPDRYVQAELPHAKELLEADLKERGILDRVDIHYGNIMYDKMLEDDQPFDLIWCAGVLYHNPEQLRMIARLFDWAAPGGHLVLETATARRFPTRDLPCVEIWYKTPKAKLRSRHLAGHISHLPSKSAVRVWLELVGFSKIEHSPCHYQQSFALSRNRAAFIGQREENATSGVYYRHTGEDFPIGRAI